MADEGRCVSCGFLGKRALHRAGTRRAGVLEVDWEERDRPNPDASFAHPLGNVVEFPEFVCLRRVAPLPDEIKAEWAKGPSTPTQGVANVLTRARDCTSWWSYIPGLDPKEHLMERRLRELEDDRKSFQLTMSRANRGLIYLGLILGACQVLAALLALLTAGPGSFLHNWISPKPPVQMPFND